MFLQNIINQFLVKTGKQNFSDSITFPLTLEKFSILRPFDFSSSEESQFSIETMTVTLAAPKTLLYVFIETLFLFFGKMFQNSVKTLNFKKA